MRIITQLIMVIQMPKQIANDKNVREFISPCFGAQRTQRIHEGHEVVISYVYSL